MSYQRIPAESENKDLHQNIEMQNIGSFTPPAPQAPGHAPQAFVAQVVVQAHVIITPPAPSPQELEITLKTRRVEFDSQRYISEGWTFAKHNCCSIIQIMLAMILVCLVTHLFSFLLLRGIYGDDFMAGWHDGTEEEPDAVHMRLFRIDIKNWHGSDGSEGPDGPQDGSEENGGDVDGDQEVNNNYFLGLMIMGFFQSLFIYGPLAAGGFMTCLKQCEIIQE